ncbi:hypothetical protein VTL71DRAFT_6240 [Oculimacula yallundae]|uniref:S-adenosyl-L-methionine-dependent methyltransferase n=1 Tax=Oculimacula yallundae TaxID=86028 RepID=A0ABR4BZT8_9HELO
MASPRNSTVPTSTNAESGPPQPTETLSSLSAAVSESTTLIGKDTDSSSIASSSAAASSIHNPALEVDTRNDERSDADSTLDSIRDSTTSLRASVYDYVEENGRTFHKYKEGKYVLPNDAIEQNRLDLQHQMCLILLEGRLHLAPIGSHPHNVLDVGTGTGIWAIDFARVTGTDLSPIQPDFVPANCQFEVDDAEDDWTFSAKFDFVHMRGMMTCFSDPRSILVKAYVAIAPGGYLEMQDSVFPMHCHDDTLQDTALDVWGKACVEGAAKIGRPWTNTPNYRGWMIELGFEDVKEKIFEVPINTWPRGRKQKELGLWWQADLLEALGASTAILTRAMGWTPEQVEVHLVQVRKDIKNRAVHGYMPMWTHRLGQEAELYRRRLTKLFGHPCFGPHSWEN